MACALPRPVPRAWIAPSRDRPLIRLTMSGGLRAGQKALPRLKRLPTLLANFELQLLPLSAESSEQLEKHGWCREAAFRTKPHATKYEIRGILEGVYGLDVESVRTINYQGKKKMNKYGYYRRPDWKKAHVTFREPSTTPLQ